MSNLQDIREKKIPLIVGSETKHLLYNLNAFAELEEIYGSISKMLDALNSGSVKAVINVLWAGLIHENENLTKKEVGNLFDLSQMVEISQIINKAILESVPPVTEPAGEESKNEQPQAQE